MHATRLYLARHGQVEGYQEKRYNGQINVSLTETGKEQSALICASLSAIALDAVYSSDLDRSRYCANLIAEDQGLAVVAEEALREINFGDWEGRTWAELQEVYPQDWQRRLQDLTNYQVPGGESLQDAADRIRPVIGRILARHAGGKIVLVAHGGLNRIVLLDAIGAALAQAFSIEQDYGCLNIIDYLDGDHAVVRLLNGTAHLSP
jgi:alpha-ribazole phosphatase/probable phosphoglycerate mutase